MDMKRIKKVTISLIILFAIMTLDIVSVYAYGTYSVYSVQDEKEKNISIANGKLSYGEKKSITDDIMPAQIVGTNNLKRIKDTTTSMRYSSRAHIKATFPNGKTANSSGTMIGPCTLITAAHCVYDKSMGGYASSVTVAPGRNGSKYPYGKTTAKEISIPNAYKTSTSAANDIAIVNLSTNIGSKSGHLICKYISNTTLLSKSFEMYGYPGTGYSAPDGSSITNGELWGMNVKVSSVSGKTLKHKGDTYHGHNGSSLVYQGEYVVAIHNRYPYSDTSYNYACRIDAEYMKWITTLIEKVSAG